MSDLWEGVGARGMNLFPRSMFLYLRPFFQRFHAISPFRISYRSRILTSDGNRPIFIYISRITKGGKEVNTLKYTRASITLH